MISKPFIKRFRWGIIAVLPASFISVATAVIAIVTLGYYRPNWELKYLFWITKWDMRNKLNNK